MSAISLARMTIADSGSFPTTVGDWHAMLSSIAITASSLSVSSVLPPRANPWKEILPGLSFGIHLTQTVTPFGNLNSVLPMLSIELTAMDTPFTDWSETVWLTKMFSTLDSSGGVCSFSILLKRLCGRKENAFSQHWHFVGWTNEEPLEVFLGAPESSNARLAAAIISSSCMRSCDGQGSIVSMACTSSRACNNAFLKSLSFAK
mmetsp:Transcript_9922/g.14938  ORF Transcript_9922/g.14938 Transcript_9922/m.14938 type:complete len:204 (-) Transcript_9922:1761-2372(-)